MASKEARELAAQIAAKTKSHNPAARERIRAGEVDDWMIVQMAEAALGRDSGIEMLREANAAFGNYTAPEPGIPELSPHGKDTLKFWADDIASMARTLKDEAQHAKELGDEMAALLIIRLQLSVEETGEWAEALASGDLKKAARELTDIQYITDGHYLTLGLGDLKLPLYRVVHGDNMRKLGPDGKPIISEAGRWVKPEGWEPTDIGPIISSSAGEGA